MSKIFIQNLVNKTKGKAEKEIAADETIRFEIGENDYRIYIEGDKLMLSKRSPNGLDTIMISPKHTNLIQIF